MSKKNQKKFVRGIWVIGILTALVMGGNWFMTYRLESILKKRLKTTVQTATDGFYDFTFDKLKIGLFSGELKMQGAYLYPDTLALQKFTKERILPKEYYRIHIDEIEFSGINLTWIFDYKKLHFKKFMLKKPDIEIVNPNLAYVAIRPENNKLKNDSAKLTDKYLYEYILPYFDYIKVDQIDFENASVNLSVQDSLHVVYKLYDFNFTAHNFCLDKASMETHHLLYSEYFNFNASTPQTLYDSQHFMFNIDRIHMSTQDSLIQIGGAHFATKQKYWDNRFNELGDWVDTKVDLIEITGVSLDKNDSNTTFSASKFMVNNPSISYVSVLAANEEQILPTSAQKSGNPGADSISWSIYSLVAPIFDGVFIDSISLKRAFMEYTQTRLHEGVTDVYKFQNLDVEAEKFRIDSTSHEFNFFYYVKDFRLDVDSLAGYMSSNNSDVFVEHFSLDTYGHSINLKNLNIKPIQISGNKNHTKGHIDEIVITGLKYTSGITADLIDIRQPSVEFTLNKLLQNKKVNKQKKEEEQEEERNQTETLLASIAPYVNYLKVEDILIDNGKFVFDDRIHRNRYELSNLNFKAKNFYLDPETEIIKDYFFTWDEYSIGFKNFNNLTPDKKYRIKIKEGEFNSVSGDMLLKQFSVEPVSKNEPSYLRLSTPYAKLQGLDQKEIGTKKLLFKTLTLESPMVEIVRRNIPDKKEASVPHSAGSAAVPLPFTVLMFDQLAIPSSGFSFYDEEKGKSIQVSSQNIMVDSLKWEFGKVFNVHKLIVDKPNISWIQEKDNYNEGQNQPGDNKETSVSGFSFENVAIRHMDINTPNIRVKTPSKEFSLRADAYLLKSLVWNTKERSVLKLDTFDFQNPTIIFKADARKTDTLHTAKKTLKKNLNIKDLVSSIPTYTNETYINFLDINNLNLTYENINKSGEVTEQKLNNTFFSIENVKSNKERKVLFINDIVFKTKDYIVHIADSFYTVGIKDIYFSKAKNTLIIDSISMISNVPKFDFAYKQPKHKDWFNLNLGQIKLSGIDIDKYIKDTILYIDRLDVDNVLLLNFKNKKITTPPKLVPLLYQIFQKVPVKYYVKDVDVSNFSVIYEELEMKGYVPGQIAFTNMHGQVEGFTNIQTKEKDFYDLKATGLAFGTAPFQAVWTMPIDSTTNQFYLKAKIEPMDLRVLNHLIRPMAPAYIKSGKLLDLEFSTSSTAEGATVDLKFLYDSLYVVVLKNMYSDEENFLLTQLVNHVAVRTSNLEGKKLRLAHETIVRDPYHSNFNYFWQILKPPLITSAGISDKDQRFAQKMGTFFTRLRSIFSHSHKEDEKKESK